jgi:hypothetical protein
MVGARADPGKSYVAGWATTPTGTGSTMIRLSSTPAGGTGTGRVGAESATLSGPPPDPRGAKALSATRSEPGKSYVMGWAVPPTVGQATKAVRGLGGAPPLDTRAAKSMRARRLARGESYVATWGAAPTEMSLRTSGQARAGSVALHPPADRQGPKSLAAARSPSGKSYSIGWGLAPDLPSTPPVVAATAEASAIASAAKSLSASRSASGKSYTVGWAALPDASAPTPTVTTAASVAGTAPQDPHPGKGLAASLSPRGKAYTVGWGHDVASSTPNERDGVRTSLLEAAPAGPTRGKSVCVAPSASGKSYTALWGASGPVAGSLPDGLLSARIVADPAPTDTHGAKSIRLIPSPSGKSYTATAGFAAAGTGASPASPALLDPTTPGHHPPADVQHAKSLQAARTPSGKSYTIGGAVSRHSESSVLGVHTPSGTAPRVASQSVTGMHAAPTLSAEMHTASFTQGGPHLDRTSAAASGAPDSPTITAPAIALRPQLADKTGATSLLAYFSHRGKSYVASAVPPRLGSRGSGPQLLMGRDVAMGVPMGNGAGRLRESVRAGSSRTSGGEKETNANVVRGQGKPQNGAEPLVDCTVLPQRDGTIMFMFD